MLSGLFVAAFLFQLSSFTAEFSVLVPGTELEHGISITSNPYYDYTKLYLMVRYYANTETKKQLQVLNLGGQEDDIQLYTWLSVEHNKTIEHDNMKPFDFCTGVTAPSSPGDENIWFWLKKATYNGTKTFLEDTVDVWIYDDKVNENYYQVGVLSNDANRPLYFLSTTAIGLAVFDSYENSTPPESVFDLPSSCTSDRQKSSAHAKAKPIAEYKSSMNVFNFKGVARTQDTRL